MKTCPFMYKKNIENRNRDLGRAYPLIKGTISHFYPEIFNKSLHYIKNNKLEYILSNIFNNFRNFGLYMKTLIGEKLVKSCERELYSFYLFKKDLYESFYSEEKIELFIPLIAEEWLSIPFSIDQYNDVKNKKKNSFEKWIKIGIHNVIDEAFIDIDNKIICIDYKSYPREDEKKVKEIKNIYKKYQLITSLLTIEYKYNMEVKFVSNIDLGTPNFPKITFHKPTSKGITYYKKSLFEAYKNLLENHFPTKYNQRYCINFCDFKFDCPDENVKKWRDTYYLNII